MSLPGDQAQLELPAEVVVKCHGFALDIGGSVVKLVYRSKEDYENALAKQPGELAPVRLVSFPRTNLDLAVEYLQNHVHLTRTKPGPIPVYSTGVGCHQFGDTLQQTLNCQLKNVSEYDCFVAAFVHLAHTLPRSRLLHPPLEGATQEPRVQAAQLMASFYRMADEGLTGARVTVDTAAVRELLEEGGRGCRPRDPGTPPCPLAEEGGIFPCLMAVCGSSCSFIKVEKDGQFEIVDDSDRGGRTFYGMGCLLTGCKTFPELLGLASRGDHTRVDVCSNDLLEEPPDGEDTGDLHAGVAGDDHNYVVYSFGKAIGRDIGEFRREDLAATLLHFTVVELVQVLELVAARHGCGTVFFTGSFAGTELMRRHLSVEFARRNAYAYTIKGEGPGVAFEFVKPGSHLGAIGALLNTVYPFLPDP